jgi:hypothetical protein
MILWIAVMWGSLAARLVWRSYRRNNIKREKEKARQNFKILLRISNDVQVRVVVVIICEFHRKMVSPN